MSRSKVTDLVRHEIFLKMPIIVFFEVSDPAVSHLILELWSTFSERFLQELSFGTIFRVSRTTFWKKNFAIGIPFLVIFQNSCLLSTQDLRNGGDWARWSQEETEVRFQQHSKKRCLLQRWRLVSSSGGQWGRGGCGEIILNWILWPRISLLQLMNYMI